MKWSLRQGSGFTCNGLSEEDYMMTVGDVQCEITSISINAIVFYPPDPSNFATFNDSKKTILYVGYSAYVFPVGYIQYYLNWIDNPVNRNGLIIGLVCGVGGVIIIILAIVPYRAYMYCKSKRASPPEPSQMIHYNLQKARCSTCFVSDTDESTTALGLSTSHGPQRNPSLMDCLSSEQKLMVEEVVVPYSRIQLVDEIGSGNFGKVYRGLFFKTKDDTEEVAIKTILTDSFVGWHEKVSFLQEAMLMKDFSHRNVLSLVAVAIENNFLYVVLPLMENGDLRGFVSKLEKHFSVLDLTSYSLQIAEGMEYLAENKFVHRDLAARNCMINKSFVVKVADFGLARDIFEKDYYRPTDANRPLPVKWMPIECLAGDSPKFTECSDVWSFGVLMWELFTRGRRPYADIDNTDMKRYLMRGDRLEQPRCTPDFMYDLMRGCWKETPTERPRFKEIVTSLREILHHAPENSRTSATYVESADETADADQLRLYIRRDGPVSYIDLSQDVPVAYLELPQVDVDSSLDETQGDLGSIPTLTKDNRGSNPKQTHYDRVI